VTADNQNSLKPSPALSLMGKAKRTLAGRKLGVLITDGFDASLLAAGRSNANTEQAAAVDWVSYAHLKVIGHTAGAQALLDRARVKADDGIVAFDAKKSVTAFIRQAKPGRICQREPSVRLLV